MDEKFRNIALTKINASFKERQEELESTIASILSDGVKHGTLAGCGKTTFRSQYSVVIA